MTTTDTERLTGRGVLVWRERDSEPGTFDLVDDETGEPQTSSDFDDTIMFTD